MTKYTKFYIAALALVMALANEMDKMPAKWHMPLTIGAIIAASLNKSLFAPSPDEKNDTKDS